MKIAIYLLLALTIAGTPLPAKTAATASQSTAPQGRASAGNPSPDAQSLNAFLKQVQISAEKSEADLSRLRIEKWKTEAATKQQAQASVVSIRRNLTNAIPDLVQRIQASPGSLNANFRLYRNLNALYDTFSALAESAGAFGSKEQYEALAADIAFLDQLRHQAAERVDLMAGTNDTELARLRAQAAATKAKPASTKIVVDDDQPKSKKKAKSSTKSSPSPSN
jgi:hypothetical protein